MKVLGIIAEYNPFHNGHLFHLREAKALTGADFVVCVMSGNFIQRGEPAIVNKWARTEMALSLGIDLVIELPTAYACASAEYFAFGAVKILNSLGIVDFLCFGSEHGNISKLKQIAELLSNEPDTYKQLLKQELNKGISFPSAREAALKQYFDNQGVSSDEIEQLTGSSNNILGIEYLKALIKLKSNILPYTIKRTSNNYTSKELTGSISSATAIRQHIHTKIEKQNLMQIQNQFQYQRKIDKDLLAEVSKTLPMSTFSILEREFCEGRGPIFPSNLERIILADIRRMSTEQLSNIAGITEGFENRLISAAKTCGTYDELIEKLSTKRYPTTRIQRSLIYIMAGLSQSQFNNFHNHEAPQYARILGFNSHGRSLLSIMKNSSTIPVITKTANFKNSYNSCHNPILSQIFQFECKLTDLYVLSYENPNERNAGSEFTQKLILQI